MSNGDGNDGGQLSAAEVSRVKLLNIVAMAQSNVNNLSPVNQSLNSNSTSVKLNKLDIGKLPGTSELDVAGDAQLSGMVTCSSVNTYSVADSVCVCALLH